MTVPEDGLKAAGPPDRVVQFGPYRFDERNRILSSGDAELPLPPRASGVLACLLEYPGRVVSKQGLIDAVWNGAYVSETSLSEAVSLLRQALSDDAQEPKYIQTIHRRGYRFIGAVAEVLPPGPADVQAGVDSADRAERTDGTDSSAASAAPAVPAVRETRTLAALGAGIAAVLVLAAAIFVATRDDASPDRAPVARFAVVPPPPLKVVDRSGAGLAVSPDGRHIVYSAKRPGSEPTLWYRDLSNFATREIPGTAGAVQPFFSADGRRIGFFADGELLHVSLAGGAAVALARVTGPVSGATWGEDDTIVYAAGSPAALYRVKPGAAVERLTRVDTSRGEVAHRWPRLLPGGEAALFTCWATTLRDARVEWLSLATGERRTVVAGAADAHFARGKLIWSAPGGSILAAPFDPERGALTAEASLLLRDVNAPAVADAGQIAVGAGTFAYIPTPTRLETRSLVHLAGGRMRRLATPRGHYRNLKAGPHQQPAVTILSREQSDIWVIRSTDGAASRLTVGGFNVEPVWSPDGRWIAFASRTNGAYEIYRRRADGSAPAERLLADANHQLPASWSPDGRELMLRTFHPVTGSDLSVLHLATGRVRPWLRGPAEEGPAAWSPDGRWVAYTSDESGRREVYVRSYPEGGGRWQVSHGGGHNPAWAADGRAIYFHEGRRMQAVPVDPTGRDLMPGVPKLILDDERIITAVPGTGGDLFGVREDDPQDPAEVRVVVGWPGALQQQLAGLTR